MAESMRSPVLMMSSSGELWEITTSAPVFSSDILLHASARSFTSSFTVMLTDVLLPNILLRIIFPLLLFMYLLPRRMRNFRISGWNMTISARTPTSRTMSMMAVISLMLNAPTSTLMMKSDTIATKMLMADVPFIHLNMKKMISPRSTMSRMSAKDISRKPNKASGVIPYKYIRAKIVIIIR